MIQLFNLSLQCRRIFRVDNPAAEGSRHKVVIHSLQQAGVTVQIFINNCLHRLSAGHKGDIAQPLIFFQYILYRVELFICRICFHKHNQLILLAYILDHVVHIQRKQDSNTDNQQAGNQRPDRRYCHHPIVPQVFQPASHQIPHTTCSHWPLQ